jgi:hypothetical protein
MQTDPVGTMSFAVSAALFEGGLAVLAVCLGWALDRWPLATFRLDWSGMFWGVIATLPPLGLLWICLKTHWRPFVRIMQVLD